MQITISKEIPFVPTWNGNDKLEKKDQIVVTHKDVTAQERSGCRITVELPGQEDIPVKDRKYKGNIDFDKLFEISEVKIKNCGYICDEKKHWINTGPELAVAPGQFANLYDEILIMLLSRLSFSEGDSKNSE